MKNDYAEFLESMGLAEEVAASNTEAATAQFEAAMKIAAPFLNPQGQDCLRRLRQMTIEQPCFVPGQDASHGFAREGQNSIVRYIETCIRVAMQGPPNAQVKPPAKGNNNG